MSPEGVFSGTGSHPFCAHGAGTLRLGLPADIVRRAVSCSGAQLAAPSQALVSQTVKDLVASSGLTIEDEGSTSSRASRTDGICTESWSRSLSNEVRPVARLGRWGMTSQSRGLHEEGWE
jgi:hypothetical protein